MNELTAFWPGFIQAANNWAFDSPGKDIAEYFFEAGYKFHSEGKKPGETDWLIFWKEYNLWVRNDASCRPDRAKYFYKLAVGCALRA